jgi:hypothetical protein
MRPKEGSLHHENGDVRTLRAFYSYLQAPAAACSARSSRMINRKIQRSPHLTRGWSNGIRGRFVANARHAMRSFSRLHHPSLLHDLEEDLVQKSVNIPKGSAPGLRSTVLRAGQTGARAR